jgi:anti-sigma factor RsiW
MKLFRRRRALECRHAIELMSDYLEASLPERDRSRLEAHLAECPHCGEYLAQLRVTIDALGTVGPDDLSPEVVDELVALYRRWRTG